MKTLCLEQVESIPGGYMQAIGAGIAIYIAWPSIVDSTSYWNNIGTNLGGWIFDVTHPNAGGQMIYTAEDLGLSYITPFPSFQVKYFSIYQFVAVCNTMRLCSRKRMTNPNLTKLLFSLVSQSSKP